MKQQSLFDRYELWVMGAIEKCVKGRGECYYQPCTVAQGVRCCAACMGCHNPCEKVRKR